MDSAALAYGRLRYGLVELDARAAIPAPAPAPTTGAAALAEPPAPAPPPGSGFLDPSRAPTTVRIRWDHLSAEYVGVANHANDVGVVRAAAPLSPGAAVPYFEVHLELDASPTDGAASGGRNLDVTVGLALRHFPSNKHLGATRGSYGYRGSDGFATSSSPASGSGDTTAQTAAFSFGPPLRSGDVIGCGLRLPTREVFFTRNGVYLGVAFRVEASDTCLYPTVGLHQAGLKAHFRFGTSLEAGFAFRPEQLVEEQQREEDEAINARRVDRDAVKAIVREFLHAMGYAETLRTFLDESSELDPESAAVDEADAKAKDSASPAPAKSVSLWPRGAKPTPGNGDGGGDTSSSIGRFLSSSTGRVSPVTSGVTSRSPPRGRGSPGRRLSAARARHSDLDRVFRMMDGGAGGGSRSPEDNIDRFLRLCSGNGGREEHGASHRKLAEVVEAHASTGVAPLDEDLRARAEVRALLRRRRALDALRTSRAFVSDAARNPHGMEVADEESSDASSAGALAPRAAFLLHCQRIIEALRAGKQDKALRIARRELSVFVSALTHVGPGPGTENAMDVDHHPRTFHAQKRHRSEISNGHTSTAELPPREAELVHFMRTQSAEERAWYRYKAGQVAALLALTPAGSETPANGNVKGRRASIDGTVRHPYLVQFSRAHTEMVGDYVNKALRPDPSLLEKLVQELAATAQLRRELAGGFGDEYSFPTVDDMAT